MLTFNSILSDEDIDPKKVRLVRHQDNRSSGNSTPYNLWLSDRVSLETYQRIQSRKVFEIGGLLASFLVTPNGETLADATVVRNGWLICFPHLNGVVSPAARNLPTTLITSRTTRR
jgi:hypothetical protein